MYIFSSHVFQITLFIIQDCSIAQINSLEEDDNLVVNESIDFRRKASKLEMSLETNIPLAPAHLDTPNIFRYKPRYNDHNIGGAMASTFICNSYLRKSSFLILYLEIRTVEYRAETPT